MAALAATLFFGAGCDAVSDGAPGSSDLDGVSLSDTYKVESGRLVIDDEASLRSLLATASQRTEGEREAWERQTGFRSLLSAHAARVASGEEVTLAEGSPVVEAPEFASLLNAEGELIFAGSLVKVSGGSTRVTDASGQEVARRAAALEVKTATSGPITAQGPAPSSVTTVVLPTNATKQFGPVSPLADSRQQKVFQIQGTIKKVDYIVYARWSAGTEAHELYKSWSRGRYYGETQANRVSLDCVWAGGQTLSIYQNNDSDIERNLDFAVVLPTALPVVGTAGQNLVTAQATCTHTVRDTYSGVSYTESVSTAW